MWWLGAKILVVLPDFSLSGTNARRNKGKIVTKIIVLATLMISAIGCRTAIIPAVKTADQPEVVVTERAERQVPVQYLKVNRTHLTEGQKHLLKDRFLRRHSEATDVEIVSGDEYECISGLRCPDDSEVVTCACSARKKAE